MNLSTDRNERSFSLSHLLPYDIAAQKNKRMIAALDEYRLLLTATEQTVAALERGCFEEFDALVGDNMCQIRVIKIAKVARDVLETVPMLKESLAAVKEKIEKLSTKVAQDSLKDVFLREDLEVMLTSDEAFLIQSYLLTLIKTVQHSKKETPLLANDKTEPKSLQKLGKVSSSFATSLVKNLRKRVSSASVEFIRECALTLPERDKLIPIVANELVVEHNHCLSLPFFFVNDILIKQTFASGIPIVVCLQQIAKDQDNKKIKQICLLFTRVLEGHQRKTIPSSEELKLPAFVLHGFMQRPYSELPSREGTIRELLNCGVVDLVLMNSADHRQSLDPSKDELVEKIGGQRLASYRTAAFEKGCSMGNPSLFFINHAFCKTIGHQESLKRKADIASVLCHLKPLLSREMIETIVEYEEEA